MEKVKVFFKRHWKKIAILIVLLVGGSVIGRGFFGGGEEIQTIASSQVTSLKKTDFENSVSENGVVKSEDYAYIYAQKSLPVLEKLVEVGDKVVEGQEIAYLDGSTIEQQIATRSAQAAQSGKTAAAQIESAQSRLNEAIANKNNGTNPQLVSAQNAISSAYDAWQSAEKTYSDYLASLNEGYNPEIHGSEINLTGLENAKRTSELSLNQSKEKLDKLRSDVLNSQMLATEKARELDALKNRDEFITRRTNEINTRVEELSNVSVPSLPSSNDLAMLDIKMNQLIRDKNDAELSGDTLRSSEIQMSIDALQIERDALVNSMNNPVTVPDNSSEVKNLKDELFNLGIESGKLKERIAEVSADKSKYENEAESYAKQIDASKMEVDQQNLALDSVIRNLDKNQGSSIAGGRTREDQLATLRKNADDLRNSYENSLKTLESTKVGVENEINSLKSSLNLAKAGVDSTAAVDIKYLKEDLEKAIVKSPISGTITEVKMVIGGVPTDYLAKVETVNRMIITSQVKEYDLNNVKVGMNVEISGESIGMNEKFKGKVLSINPTPILNANTAGATAESVYETKISIENGSDKIKPGMNIRVKYILEKQKDVFTIPSTSIITKNKKEFVMVIGDDGIVKEIPVNVGSENEFETVVMGDELKEGINIINTPENYQAGMKLAISEDAPAIIKE